MTGLLLRWGSTSSVPNLSSPPIFIGPSDGPRRGPCSGSPKSQNYYLPVSSTTYLIFSQQRRTPSRHNQLRIECFPKLKISPPPRHPNNKNIIGGTPRRGDLLTSPFRSAKNAFSSPAVASLMKIAQIRVSSAAPVVTIYKSAPLPHEASRKCSHIKESTYA